MTFKGWKYTSASRIWSSVNLFWFSEPYFYSHIEILHVIDVNLINAGTEFWLDVKKRGKWRKGTEGNGNSQKLGQAQVDKYRRIHLFQYLKKGKRWFVTTTGDNELVISLSLNEDQPCNHSQSVAIF